MASISFKCPNCNSLCAFKDMYKGRRARCLQCNQIFIIPDKGGAKAEKIEQPKETEKPLLGFYEAVFKYSLPAIFNKNSLTTLLFILIVTVIKFYYGHFDYSVSIPTRSGGTINLLLPVGSIISILIWGGILYCYSEIIYSTAFDVESLPEVTFGGGFGYLFTVLKSLYAFFVAIVVVFLPFIIVKWLTKFVGFEIIWLNFLLIAFGIFLFPMAVLTISIGRDLTMLLRPDYFFMPIKKGFKHYIFVTMIFALLCGLLFMIPNNGSVLNLFSLLAVQILAVFEMRIIGLFYRHFACYFKW